MKEAGGRNQDPLGIADSYPFTEWNSRQKCLQCTNNSVLILLLLNMWQFTGWLGTVWHTESTRVAKSVQPQAF